MSSYTFVCSITKYTVNKHRRILLGCKETIKIRPHNTSLCKFRFDHIRIYRQAEIKVQFLIRFDA